MRRAFFFFFFTNVYLTTDGAASTWPIPFTCYPSPTASASSTPPAEHTGASGGKKRSTIWECSGIGGGDFKDDFVYILCSTRMWREFCSVMLVVVLVVVKVVVVVLLMAGCTDDFRNDSRTKGNRSLCGKC